MEAPFLQPEDERKSRYYALLMMAIAILILKYVIEKQ